MKIPAITKVSLNSVVNICHIYVVFDTYYVVFCFSAIEMLSHFFDGKIVIFFKTKVTDLKRKPQTSVRTHTGFHFIRKAPNFFMHIRAIFEWSPKFLKNHAFFYVSQEFWSGRFLRNLYITSTWSCELYNTFWHSCNHFFFTKLRRIQEQIYIWCMQHWRFKYLNIFNEKNSFEKA